MAGEIDLVRRLGQPVIPQGDGAALVDVQPGQLGIRVGENPLRAVGSLQQDITEHGLALGQFLAAIKLLLNAQNAVVFLPSSSTSFGQIVSYIIKRQRGPVNA